jgi:hypothetical protein
MSETALRTVSAAVRPGPTRDGGAARSTPFSPPRSGGRSRRPGAPPHQPAGEPCVRTRGPELPPSIEPDVALYADHGVVHARDVALMLLQVLDTANGRLIPTRAPDRLGWMKAYGVLLACLHDIGMADCSPVGRAIHPEFATHVVLGPELDCILRQLRDDAGGIAARIIRLGRAGALGGRAPEAVLREARALANCHSKSKVPTELLNDPGALRRAMLAAATAEVPARTGRPGPLHADFTWLEMATGPGRELVEDVVDTLRGLRCADALRQRGTALKTSGGDEIFVDERSANAVYALRPDPAHLYGRRRRGEPRQQPTRCRRRPACLLPPRRVPRRRDDAQGGAERGAGCGGHPGRRDRQLCAERRRRGSRAAAGHSDIRILIESADENPAFARQVRVELGHLDPAAAAGTRIVACLAPRRRRSGAVISSAPTGLGPRTPVGGAAADRPLRLPDPGDRPGGGVPRGAADRAPRRRDPDRGGRPLALRLCAPWRGAARAAARWLSRLHHPRRRPRRGDRRHPRRGAKLQRRGGPRPGAPCRPKEVFLDHWHVTYDEPAFAALLAPQAG